MEKKETNQKNVVKKNATKKSNSNYNGKKTTYSRVEKNQNYTVKNVIKADDSIKKEIKEENNSNKKVLIIFALILALCIGVFAYAKSNDKEDDEKKPISVEKEEEPEEEDEPIAEEEKKEIEEEESKIEYVYIAKEKVVEKEPTPVKKNEADDEKKIYTLTFETNGGNEIKEQYLDEDEVTVQPVISPQRENKWRFAGWYSDSEFNESFEFGKILDKDTIIYAKWVKTIKFSADGQTTLDGKDIDVADGEIIKLLGENDIDEGLVDESHVVAWFVLVNDIRYEILEGTKLSDETINIDSSEIVLKLNPLAKFEMNFHIDDETVESYTKTVVAGRVVDFTDVNENVLENNENINIELIGWYSLDGEVQIDFPINKVADENITDIYLSETYAITYTEKVIEEEEEKINEIDKINYSKDSKIKVLVPEEKENMKFDGWYVQEDDTEVKIEDDYVITKDIIVIGKWNEISLEDIEEDEPLVDEEMVPMDNKEIEEQTPEEVQLSNPEEEKPIDDVTVTVEETIDIVE